MQHLCVLWRPYKWFVLYLYETKTCDLRLFSASVSISAAIVTRVDMNLISRDRQILHIKNVKNEFVYQSAMQRL